MLASALKAGRLGSGLLGGGGNSPAERTLPGAALEGQLRGASRLLLQLAIKH